LPAVLGRGLGVRARERHAHLSAAARSLYAGAKQTKDGIEVKLTRQDKHLELLMRHLGLLNDKLEVTGDLGERIIAARKRARGAT
jgi:phage terminase small subunit